jgi:hypothetical protein
MIRIHIPTAQYEFVEIDLPDSTTPVEVKTKYDEYVRAFKVNEGISTKEFNSALDRYLNDGTGDTETYLNMSPDQQRIFQEIKKSIKRTEDKNTK